MNDMAHKKIKVALMADVFDRRPERALFARRLIERLVVHPDIDLTLVHFTPMPDEPMYKAAHEVLIPKIALPVGSRFVSFMYYCLTAKDRFDIFQYLVGRPYPFFWLFPAKKFVILAHDAGVARVPGSRTIPNIISYLTLRFFHRHIDMVLGVSEFARKEIEQVYHLPASKTAVVYNGIEASFAPVSAEEVDRVVSAYQVTRGNYIFYLGGLQPHKNVPSLVKAYEVFRRTNPHATHTLLLGGTPRSSSEPVYKAAHASAYAKDISFAGFVPWEHVSALHSGAAVFVFPSLHEGFGMPPVEAMACGASTVVSNATSLPEATGGASVLVDASNPVAIAEGIGKVLNDPALQDAMRKKGFENVKRFSWDSYAAAHVELYKRLAGYSEA